MSTFDEVLADVRRGTILPAYLLTGSEEQVLRDAARTLVEEIVPEADRSFNLARHDGTGRPSEIADDLCSVSLLGGRRVVLVLGATFLASGKDLARSVLDLVDLWDKGREADSTRRAVALFSEAGFSRDDLAKGTKKSLAAFKRSFGLVVEKGDPVDSWRAALHARLVETDREIPPPSGGPAVLEAVIREGRAGANTLVVTARKADRSLGLVRAIREVGTGISLDVGIGRQADRFVEATFDDFAREAGLALEGAARASVIGRLRPDREAIRLEVDKLATFADGARLGSEDVERLVPSARDDPAFLLQGSLAERDLDDTLRRSRTLLRAARDPGGEAIRLVGMLASEVRRLIRARALLAGPLRGFSAHTSSRDFESRIFPSLSEQEGAGPLASGHPFRAYRTFQGALRYRGRELIAMLRGLAGLDRALKSSPADPELLLERFLVNHLAPGAER